MLSKAYQPYKWDVDFRSNDKGKVNGRKSFQISTNKMKTKVSLNLRINTILKWSGFVIGLFETKATIV